MSTKNEVTREALAAKIAAGEALSVEEVMALNAISSKESERAKEIENAQKVKNFAKECSKEIAGFEGDAKELKVVLRNFANKVPTVSGNGSAHKPIDLENVKTGSVTEFVTGALKGSQVTKNELVNAAKNHFSDRKSENVKASVENVVKRLSEHITEKEGKLTIA